MTTKTITVPLSAWLAAERLAGYASSIPTGHYTVRERSWCGGTPPIIEEYVRVGLDWRRGLYNAISNFDAAKRETKDVT
jgi:hypothetical protein